MEPVKPGPTVWKRHGSEDVISGSEPNNMALGPKEKEDRKTVIPSDVGHGHERQAAGVLATAGLSDRGGSESRHGSQMMAGPRTCLGNKQQTVPDNRQDDK